MHLKRRWLFGVVAAVVALAGATMLPAAQEKKAAEKSERTADDIIADAVTAYKMADFGRDHKSPEALVAAASLLRSLQGIKMDAIAEKPTGEDDKTPADGQEEKVKSFAEQADELFDEASALGLTLKLAYVEPMIKAARAREYRTRAVVGGPKTIRRGIGPRKTESFHFKFQPNQIGSIGFRASIPMKITVVRSDTSNVIADGVVPVGHVVHHFGNERRGTVPVTVRVQNMSGQKGSFQLFVN